MEHPPIGIDLGTTNSLIAVFENGAPRLLSNVLGNPLTPSVISIEDKTVHVGEAARDRLNAYVSICQSRSNNRTRQAPAN